jgi:hypothetical protein
MKELLLILLVALATCATVEESFDDDVILEKSGISIKPTVPHITKPTKITLPKTSVPRTSPPRTSPPRTSPPRTSPPRTSPPKTNVPRTYIPKTNVPKTNVPKTNVPKTNVPKTNVPITNVPKTNVPKTNVPKTNVPKTNVPKLEHRKNLNEVKKVPLKGINNLFGTGKVGEIFRKLGDMIKKGIAWLKKNNLWNPIIEALQNLGVQYGNELCEKALPPEVCGPAVDFAIEHLLPSEQN